MTYYHSILEFMNYETFNRVTIDFIIVMYSYKRQF